MQEKRRAKRMKLDVAVKLGTLNGQEQKKYINVDIIDLSRRGVAFKCKQQLEVNECYDTRITIWTKDKVEAVIRIVRKAEDDVYGAEFIALASADDLKILIYELFNYKDEEE